MSATHQRPTRLHLLRHGEVEASYQRVFGGRIDMNLSPFGRQQAEALAKYLSRHPVDAIFASPMKRAQQTLAPLLRQFNLASVTCPDLREVDFGDWTGLSWTQVHERYGIRPFEWLDKLHLAEIPNGECGRRFRERVEPCLRQILQDTAGQSVAIVCHGGVIRMILSILLELPLPKTSVFEIEYASLTQVDLHPGRTEIQLLNFTPWREPSS